MLIQINTDHNIAGHEGLTSQVSGVVEGALSRFSEYIMRVKIHLSDGSSHRKDRDDKRCMIEARLAGRQPIAVTHTAETLDLAVDGAADKLTNLIESTIDRWHNPKSHTTDAFLSESKHQKPS
jgi:hypothetical protein